MLRADVVADADAVGLPPRLLDLKMLKREVGGIDGVKLLQLVLVFLVGVVGIDGRLEKLLRPIDDRADDVNVAAPITAVVPVAGPVKRLPGTDGWSVR